MTGSTVSMAACRGAGPDTPPVVLIHGVGFGPATLAPLAAALAPYARVEMPARRGYGDRAHVPPAATVAEHVDDVLAALDEAGVGCAIVAGMSGGATVALALALRAPERVLIAVAHEPAVGSMSPELRALVRGALTRGGGSELVRVLAGAETWGTLSAGAVSALNSSSGLVEADAAAFLAFEPQLAAAASPVPLVCSVGERSSELRYTIAERLAARTGAPVAVVPGCGHLPQFDAPEAFAELILEQALIKPRGLNAT
ncbi:MAG TPA: alpha/beta hydrolase [Solirubrobacteraceae bacterium]